ncbi:PEP-CTERM sorting domain-containing protein [Allorhodopirellula heiligendammensis]|uniref:Ice-binding protein C-terminal domain-containing protein n=1 Tax=Allorhodopirellula heiligendammensis TaxID=2714739 RepID=A0A5C6BGR8_9BACT|nr:PEP-CTERM sorting domain-containing protein [Allorhodopirellula heiligendammensis]TWU10912.1 hypothetical protein Poly21_48180 [Allorhodopirellula heiligendammensis]
MFDRRYLVALVVLSCTAILASNSTAGVLVTTPPGDGVSGNGQSEAPFNLRGDGNGNRYQQVYSASFFAGVGPLQSISSVAFRPKQGAFGSFISSTVTFDNLIVNLSTTPRTPTIDFRNGISSDLDLNPGADSQQVFGGPITLTTDRLLFDSDVEDFDFKIAFQTPFLYRPSLGNLLLEVIVPAGVSASSNFTRLDTIIGGVSSFPGATGMASARDANLTDGISIGSNTRTGLVTQFETEAVPEPATAAMFIGMVVLVGVQSRRRRKRA